MFGDKVDDDAKLVENEDVSTLMLSSDQMLYLLVWIQTQFKAEKNLLCGLCDSDN